MRASEALVSSLAIPNCRLCIVLRNAFAKVEQQAKVELRAGITLIRCFAIPNCRLSIILGNPFAIFV